MWREWGNEGNKEGANVAESEAHDAAHDAENHGFEEELQKDVAAAGANGFADTDFACAFGDGDEHDIHDADAANDEGNASNNGEHF